MQLWVVGVVRMVPFFETRGAILSRPAFAVAWDGVRWRR